MINVVLDDPPVSYGSGIVPPSDSTSDERIVIPEIELPLFKTFWTLENCVAAS